MLTENQERLLTRIKGLGRLLTEEEIIDFYIEYHTRGTCYTISTINGLRTMEDNLKQVKGKAMHCYVYALGRIVLNGDIQIL